LQPGAKKQQALPVASCRQECHHRGARGAAVPVSSKQLQHLLRQLVGLRHHRIAGLLQDLRAAEVRGFDREVGVDDAAAAALWFSIEICRLLITASKRDCDAP
jgi:hypothetical protein